MKFPEISLRRLWVSRKVWEGRNLRFGRSSVFNDLGHQFCFVDRFGEKDFGAQIQTFGPVPGVAFYWS